MTSEQIAAWQAEHGGAAGTPETDANGNVTHRAADGSYVVVRPNGTLAMRGFRPGSATSTPPTMASSAPTPTGGGMNQQQIEAWIAQNGGAGGVQYNSSTRRIRNPARLMTNADGSENPNYDPAAPEWIDVAEESWTNSKTGATLRVSRRPDNSFDVLENKSSDPNKPPPATERPQTVPTNTTERNIVTRNPDGSIRTDPNPNYKPPTPDTKYITAQDGTVYEVEPGKPPRAIISGAKPGSTVAVNGGKTLLYVGQDGTTKVVWQSEAVNEEASYNTQTGQYEVVTKDPTGRVTGVRAVPVTGAGQRKPGPALPTMVVGMSSDALRQYADQLNASVAAGDMTPAERDKRWGEAMQAAQHAVNEATVIQRNQESNLNARVNLATTRYANEMDGLNNALSFVSKLNGMLPEGSPLGGQAFAALLGMQAIARKRSGIDDITIPTVSQQSAQGQQIANATANATATTGNAIDRLTNPANPQAVAADRAAVQAQLEAAQRPAQQNAGAGPGEPPARANVPPQPAAAAPSAPGAAAPAPPLVAPGIPVNASGNPLSELGQPGDPGYVDQAPVFSPIQGTQVPNMKPDVPPTETYGPGQFPGGAVLPQPSAPASYGASGDVQGKILPGDDFAILAQYQQPQQAPIPTGGHAENAGLVVPGAAFPFDAGRPSMPIRSPEGVDVTNNLIPQPSPGPIAPWDRNMAPGTMMRAPMEPDFPVIKAAQIESKPPWRLSPEEIQWAEQHGLMDRAMRVPGVMA